MTGETDLAKMLRTLRPLSDDTRYGYGMVAAGNAVPEGLHPLCRFEEEEGTTLVAPQEMLAAAGIPHLPNWARITISVHSALEAVGLTAAMAAALTEAGISANVIAAYHHDHIFVPWDQREKAAEVLSALAARSAT